MMSNPGVIIKFVALLIISRYPHYRRTGHYGIFAWHCCWENLTTEEKQGYVRRESSLNSGEISLVVKGVSFCTILGAPSPLYLVRFDYAHLSVAPNKLASVQQAIYRLRLQHRSRPLPTAFFRCPPILFFLGASW
jgi:hypothetical protein